MKYRYADGSRFGDLPKKHEHNEPKIFSFKATAVAGAILPLTKNLQLQTAKSGVLGGEFCFEMPSWHAYPWQHYLADPTLGVSILALDLGHPTLGQMVAVYPYLAFRLVDTKHFLLYIKTAAGLSFFTKTYTMCDTLQAHFYSETANTSIGSIINMYLGAGLNTAFPIKNGWAVRFDLEYRHASNGNIIKPNGSLNIVTASLGVSYTLDYCVACDKSMPRKRIQPLPYEWNLNITASGGVGELHHLDLKKQAIASIHVGGSYNATNWYAVGLGADVFYNGMYTRQGTTPEMNAEQQNEQQHYTSLNRYLITDDAFTNKLRVGLAVTNEFRFGRVSAILDWGVYLYNPLRNKQLKPHPKYADNRPMFYRYNINDDDGWNYFRLGIRCRIVDNVYLQAALKTHLHRTEMLEWGIGYHIPLKRKQSNHSSLTATFDGYEVFHHRP